MNHWMYLTYYRETHVNDLFTVEARSTYPDLASLAIAAEFSNNGSGSKIRRHGEVCETGGRKNDDGQLVEESGTAGTLYTMIRQSNEKSIISHIPKSLSQQ
jgi:hypothetical protein